MSKCNESGSYQEKIFKTMGLIFRDAEYPLFSINFTEVLDTQHFFWTHNTQLGTGAVHSSTNSATVVNCVLLEVTYSKFSVHCQQSKYENQ